ncbi:MAG: aminoacetone oxidase family FAD-binding enzyme [Candidatus Eisenbacteria bacterium]|uniref:Aminoacetone oxidase family FAD-binding enzyme n=1 Tax=Eiseniibacteriota bacterium TaxID=2212470 RepID=A0A538TGK9_UNCEI|nr:MAG: aminoacetone oxidase family FAD-binding enzyme [Candidatus Eisenbacteria bacterium]
MNDPVIVIGAGAAGFMAAIFSAGGPGGGGDALNGKRRVLLLERTHDGGRKILMSGGGRCNVLPSELDPARFVTASSPNTLKKLLLAWPLREQRRFFEEDLGIQLALEEGTGKLFPVSNKAKDVRDSLRAMAERNGVEMRFDAYVNGLEPEGAASAGREAGGGKAGGDDASPSWKVRLASGVFLRASRVIIATGGLSIPATGSDGTGIDIVRRLGHTIHDTYPALTPLTLVPPRYGALSGISLPVSLEAPGPKRKFTTRGGFLFTHKGYSGPSVLNLSHLAILSKRDGGPAQEIFVQWTERDEKAWDRALREGEGSVLTALRRSLPARLAEALLEDVRVDGTTPLSQLSRDERLRVVEALTHHRLPWTGDEGYKRAEVTGGGVALNEIDPRTLESRLHPGLYLCGEILDAFGPIGGYNFAWAFSTGRAAGLGAARPPGGDS